MLELRLPPVLAARFSACAALALAAAGCGDNRSFLPESAAVAPLDEASLSCVPNLDGRLDATELAPRLDVVASFYASPPGETRAVSLAGVIDAEGRRVFTLDALAPSDRRVSLRASALASQWFASAFPTASFVAPLDPDGGLVGACSHDDHALWLHGVASLEEAPATGKTLVVYDEPVPLLRFPLAPGRAWTAVGRVGVGKGTLRGLPYVGEERYEIRDDATGLVELPDVVFTQAHRVRTTLVFAPAAGAEVVSRQTAFFFECFGEIARATSAVGEPNDDFTLASALRRLAL